MHLHRSKQEKEERQKEMEQGDRRNDDLPRTRNAVQIPFEFTRNIARINNQQLAKRNISPEKDEGQQQVPEVVVMGFVDDAGQRRTVLEQRQHQNRKSV